MARVCLLPYLGLMACSLGCGPAEAVDVGVDFSPSDIDRIATPSGAALDPSGGTPGLGPFVAPDASPYCQDQYVPCGGLLAGQWEMLDTCTKETDNPKALQIWGQIAMNLDTAACYDAVERVKSEWKGRLVFEGGLAQDQRVRTDTIEMTLTRSCLNATFQVTIKPEQMGSVCGSLTNTMRSCIPVSGACQCSSRRESETRLSGTYGVLGKVVVIGMGTASTQQFFDYCVQPEHEQMLWRDQATGRLMAMRRLAETDPTDPVYVPVR